MKKSLLVFAIDMVVAALLFLGVWVFNYVLPQKGVSAVDIHEVIGSSDTGRSSVVNPLQNLLKNKSGLVMTNVKKGAQDWHKKFAD